MLSSWAAEHCSIYRPAKGRRLSWPNNRLVMHPVSQIHMKLSQNLTCGVQYSSDKNPHSRSHRPLGDCTELPIYQIWSRLYAISQTAHTCRISHAFASYLAFSCTVRNKPKILWTRNENWKPILDFPKAKNSVSGKGNRTRRVTQSLADATAVRLDVSRVFSYMYRLIERLYTRGVHKTAQWKVDSHIPSTNQTPALHSTSISGVFRRGVGGGWNSPKTLPTKI